MQSTETESNLPQPRMNHPKRSSSIRSWADIISSNDDLLTAILLFLPAKSLIRFKSVSKHWRTLISSHYFSHLHTFHRRSSRHIRPQQSFLLHTNSFEFFVCDLTIRKLIPFRFRFPFVKIMQSCNGLLLLQCRNHPDDNFEYYIFNPTTMQSRNLFLPGKYFSGLCLIFDPSESPHYKVVCVFYYKNSTCFLVYHSEKHEWEDHDTVTSNFWDSIYFNNGIYFFRSGTSSNDYIHKIPAPRRISSPGPKQDYTMESNGYLHHLRVCLTTCKNRLHAYETEEIEHGWSKKYRFIDFNPILATSSGNNRTAIELLDMIRGETINDSILLFHVPGKIMIYRFGDKVFELLVDFTRQNHFQKDRLQFGLGYAHRFIYSLAPV